MSLIGGEAAGNAHIEAPVVPKPLSLNASYRRPEYAGQTHKALVVAT
jgi:hypothetical protein